MADKKISQLNPLTTAGSGDVFPIVDTFASETKKITLGNLMASPGAIGGTTPGTGAFTSLVLPTGATIAEFSTDSTLAGDSDTAVPTEKAVKGYVDTALSTFSTNKIWQGDSYVEVLDTTATSSITFRVDNTLIADMDANGLRLDPSGTRVESFTTDGNLGNNSDNNVPTEKAVKTYVDNAVGSISGYQIIQQDTYVRVVDDGTATGYAEIVADGTQVAYFDSLSTTQRIGKETDAGKIEISDTSVNISLLSDSTDSSMNLLIGNYNYLSVDRYNQRIGRSDKARIELETDISASFGFENTEVKVFNQNESVVIPDGYEAVAQFDIDEVFFAPDGDRKLTIDTTGIMLVTGVHVDHISNDPSLSSASQTALATEYAVKQYVDTHGGGGGAADRIVDGLALAQVSDSTTTSSFIVSLRDQKYSNDSTSSSDTFYFNATDTTASQWTNPGNMVDGSIGTNAQAGSASGAYQHLNSGNTATIPVTDKYITKVEIRVYGRDGEGPNISSFNIYPVFNGSIQGNSHNLRSFLGPVRSWTPWIDISTDPSAPSSWTWADVVNLDTKVEAIIGSPGGGLGDVLEVNKIELKVTYNETPATVESVEKLKVDIDGLTIEKGSKVDEFSTDGTLSDNSNSALPTERAVKTYVDGQIQEVRNDLDLINIRYINSDSTSVTGDVCLVDTTNGLVNITLLERPEGKIVIKKVTTDNNPIYVTSTPGSSIDGQATYTIDTPWKSITFLSDGNKFFII
jgi:hypothetical protein